MKKMYLVICILALAGASFLFYAFQLQIRYNQLHKIRSMPYFFYDEVYKPFMETYDTYFVPCVVLGTIPLVGALLLGCLVMKRSRLNNPN